MRTRKLIVLMVVMMLLISSIPSYATETKGTNNGSDEVLVSDSGHGEFKLSANSISTDSTTAGKQIKVKKIKYDIYEITDAATKNEDKEYDKLFRVKEDTFLRVKEIPVDLTNKDQVETILTNYNVNPEMAKSIRNLSEEALKPNRKR